MERGAGLTVLNLRDMSRCLSCRRLVSQRRILSFGACKCGSRKLIAVTFLDSDDLLEIEEDYGWNVKITGVGRYNVSERLLSTGHSAETPDGSRVVEIDEARLHSTAAAEFRRARNAEHQSLGRVRAALGIGLPWSWARDPRKLRDVLRAFRKPSVSRFVGRAGGEDVGGGAASAPHA